MTEICIDMLAVDNVSIIKETEIGIWRKTYVNSVQGRQELQSEIQEPYLSEILSVWGDTPTEEEFIPEISEIIIQPTEQDKVNANLMLEIAKLKAKVGTV
jgi:hypothetical protein